MTGTRNSMSMRKLVVLVGLLAMLAILRKLIIFDLGTTNAGQLLGLSAAIFALGLVYWIVLEDKRKAKPISG